MTKKSKDPLAPLETGLQVLLGLLALLGVSLLASALLGGSPSIAGVGSAEVCVDYSPGEGGVGYGGTGSGGDQPMGLNDGVRWFPREIDLCDTDPSAATFALGITLALIGPAGAVGALLLLWWVVRRARREGVFSDRIPSALYVLGCFLLSWALIGWMATGLINALLLRRMASTTDGFIFSSPEFPIVSVLLGLGMLTLGRVMSQAVVLREDSEATI